jgi:hypothetical protein
MMDAALSLEEAANTERTKQFANIFSILGVWLLYCCAAKKM